MSDTNIILENGEKTESLYTPEEILKKWEKKDEIRKKSSTPPAIRVGEYIGTFQLKIHFEDVEKIYSHCSLYYVSLVDSLYILKVSVKLEDDDIEKDHIFVKDMGEENWILVI